jgi:hypothetical protein
MCNVNGYRKHVGPLKTYISILGLQNHGVACPQKLTAKTSIFVAMKKKFLVVVRGSREVSKNWTVIFNTK